MYSATVLGSHLPRYQAAYAVSLHWKMYDYSEQVAAMMVHHKDVHVLHHVYGAGMRRGRCGRKMMREGKMTSFSTSLTPSFLARYAYMVPVLLAASLGKRLKKGSTGSGEEAVNIPIQTPPCMGG